MRAASRARPIVARVIELRASALNHPSRLEFRLRDALHARAGHALPSRSERAGGVDRAAGVFDHGRVEARLARVERGPGNAEIRREPAQEDVPDAVLAQIPGEPGGALAVGFDEGGVAVDLRVVALAYHEPSMRHRQPRVKRSPFGPLDAVVGPQNLLSVLKWDTLKRLPPHVTRRE